MSNAERGVIQTIVQKSAHSGEPFLIVTIGGKEYQAWRDSIQYCTGKVGQEIEFTSNTKPGKGNYPAVTYLNIPGQKKEGTAQGAPSTPKTG